MDEPKYVHATLYMEAALGYPLKEAEMVPISADRVGEILWPLGQVFRPMMPRIEGVEYQSKFEDDADLAIRMYALEGKAETFSALPAPALKVVIERYQQLLVVVVTNRAAQNRMTLLPKGLPERAELSSILLLLLHEMKLPFPPGSLSRPSPS